MTMTTGHLGRKSVEEVRTEQIPEPRKFQQWKGISCKKQTITQLRERSLINVNLCDGQKPRAMINTKERIQHQHRHLSEESQA
jgi:hypothetical protein